MLIIKFIIKKALQQFLYKNAWKFFFNAEIKLYYGKKAQQNSNFILDLHILNI
jgi:hypothetical protein